MPAYAGLTPTPLVWLRDEIDRAVRHARDAVAGAAAAPQRRTPALTEAAEHVRQVRGAMAMLAYDGATRYCEAVESALAHMPGNPVECDAEDIPLVDRALFALTQFVDDIAKGEPNVPLKLFPLYRDLRALAGDEGASEIDLFYPDTSPTPPVNPGSHTLGALELVHYVRRSRSGYQRGLLAWLGDAANREGLQAMRRTLDQLDQVALQLDAPRALWWTGIAFIDTILLQSPEVSPVQARPLLSRLERIMRDVAEGGARGGPELLRALLYPIASSRPVSRRVREVKALFALDALVPEYCVSGTLEHDLGALAPLLGDMRAQLATIEDDWVRYTAGRSDLRPLREHIGTLKIMARDLGHYRLVKLLDVTAMIAMRLPETHPRQNEVLALEMAAAFLFMEGMLDSFTSPPPDIDQQVAVMAGWLLDAVKPGGRADAGGAVRDDITQRSNLARIRAQVAREILANLHEVEKVVDEVARDPANRPRMAALEAGMRQTAGALKMLGYSRANAVLSACDHLVRLCLSDESLVEASLEWVADGLSCLGFYVESIAREQFPTEALLLGFLDRLAQRDSHPAGTTAWVPAAEAPCAETRFGIPPPGAPPAAQGGAADGEAPPTLRLDTHPDVTLPVGVSGELRGVFVEEAAEVLASVAEGLALLRQRHGDVEALGTVRRGFHTLKGSGRMVGLSDLGDFAWEIEQTLNDWLRTNRASTGELLGLVERSGAAFAAWVAAMRQGAVPDLSGVDALVDAARALRGAAVPDEADPAGADDGPGAPAPQPVLDEIAIGDVRLSRSLHEIYVGEALAHLQTLQAELQARAADPERPVGAALLRIAHTLASSSRTTGFLQVATLAAMLEEYLGLALGSPLSATALDAIRAGAAELDRMVDSIVRGEPPPPADAALHRLRTLLGELLVAGRDSAPPAAPATPHAPEDDLDAQLLPVFLEESAGLVPQLMRDLRTWRAHPSESAPGRALARALHTLKGGARMAGAIRLGELIHAIESRVQTALETGEAPVVLFDELGAELDRVADWADATAGERLVPPPGPFAQSSPIAPPRAPAAAAAAAAATLRLEADGLDRLVNQTAEVNIARTRIEGEVGSIKQALVELTEAVTRLRGQLRDTQIQADSQMQSRLTELERDARDFDPLEFDRYTRLQELTRLMAESAQDVQALHQSLLASMGEVESALSQQGRASRDLHQSLLDLRSVPFGLLSDRLERTVRQAVRQLGREASLEIGGEQIELDRTVLQRIAAPLEHMLRNAVAHGIEPPEGRTARGKPATGRIVLTLEQEGAENVIALSDDGAGLDFERIRLEGLRLGLVEPGTSLPEPELAHLIFAPGFSTAGSLTSTAGRGIGMDVVRSEVAALGGTIDVASQRGAGTTLRMRIPQALAASHALVVRAGRETYAVPSGLIEQVRELKPDELGEAYAQGALGWQGRSHALYYLPQLLGRGERTPDIRRHNVVALMRSGEQRIAVHVDQILRNQEIVLKHIGPQLARVPGVVGATVLGNGQIVLILNPLQISARGPSLPLPAPRLVADDADAAVVMVVDDSLTVRRLAQRMLEREGYRVETAKDGVDALQKLQDVSPRLLLLDIEMPRMDGFELLKQLRADPLRADVPVIVITSRTADKHRHHAMELGASAFFGKPYQEAELLARIRGFLGGNGDAIAA